MHAAAPRLRDALVWLAASRPAVPPQDDYGTANYLLLTAHCSLPVSTTCFLLRYCNDLLHRLAAIHFNKPLPNKGVQQNYNYNYNCYCNCNYVMQNQYTSTSAVVAVVTFATAATSTAVLPSRTTFKLQTACYACHFPRHYFPTTTSPNYLHYPKTLLPAPPTTHFTLPQIPRLPGMRTDRIQLQTSSLPRCKKQLQLTS